MNQSQGLEVLLRLPGEGQPKTIAGCSGMAENRVREALFYESLGGEVQCLTCERRCLIAEGETGFCATRKNIG